MKPIQGLTIALLRLDDGTHRVHLEGPRVGERRAAFEPPYSPEDWQVIAQGLEPTFDIDQAPPEVQDSLRDLGYPQRLHQTIGAALVQALLAGEQIEQGFDIALGLAEAARQPLPIELRFGGGSDALAALPWELLHHNGRFLVADTSIALTRYPEEAIPPTRAMADLPMRVLLVLSEPAGASPIFSHLARQELLHGLRAMDEAGAVVVDLLRPPTYDVLIEALTNGGYHLLAFYGHGVYDEGEGGGCLLFEDEFGGPDLVPAAELGAALRNTSVRMALMGACQSAQTGASDLWSGAAPTLLRAGVPLAVGMQVSMRVDAALAFIRQFALALAAGRPVVEAVAQARKPLVRRKYNNAWFIPALYGRPAAKGELWTRYRLFDPAQPLPKETEDARAEMQARRTEIDGLETAIGEIGMLARPAEIAGLRQARAAFASARAELGRRTPGGYAAVTSPLYGVPSNPVFVGRVPELREVSQELAGDQPVVIWGAGGIGKTALAIEVAHRQSWRFPGGVLWLDCRGGPAWDSLLDRIGGFCGIAGMEQVPPGEKNTRVRWALGGLGARCLLVWDNAEDVWDGREVRRFVENLPHNCQVLLTTRQDPQRAMWPTLELRPLVDEAMVELFTLLANAARVKIGSQSDLDCIPLIVAHLEGHPLALTLIVSLAKRRRLSRIWRELGRRTPEEVEAAFALSYKRLSRVQQRLFARLSVLTIPFDWEAAEALLPGAEEAGEALDVLVGRALVAFDGARYAYHALLRQYAYAKLQETEDPRPVHRLAAETLRTKITSTEQGGTPEEGLEEVDQWQQAEEWEQMARRASALVGILDRLGYWGEIQQRLEAAQAAVQQHLAERIDLDALLLNALGTIAAKAAEWDLAIEFFERVLDISEREENIRGLAGAYNNLGLIYADKGEWDLAIEYFEKDLETMEPVEAFHEMAQTTNNLGSVYKRKGEWDRAIESYEWALETMERVGDIHGMAQTTNNLGLVHASKGDWERAIDSYEQALEFYERMGDIHGMAQTFGNLGSVYAGKGEWDRATERYEQALETMERVGDIHGVARSVMGLGTIYSDKGEWGRAIECFEQALDTMERVGDIHGMAQTLANLGSVYASKGEWDRAIECFEQAFDTMERTGDIHGMAQTAGNLGNVYASKGEWDRAIGFYEQSLVSKEGVGDIHGMAQTFGNLGLLYLQTDRIEEAKPLLGRAYLILAQLGSPDAQTAAGNLVKACGSVEEAQVYVAQLAAEGDAGEE